MFIGRLITACGIKPIGPWQWLFKAFGLYGSVEPATGESFFLQFSHADTVCYQAFLDEFFKAYSNSLNSLQVDNRRFHTSNDLAVPENVILLFQPPYCPELNLYAFGETKPYEQQSRQAVAITSVSE